MKDYQLKPSVNNRNDAAIEKILSATAESEGNRHPDAIRRLHQLRANGMGREEAVQAIANIYPPGSGKDRRVRIEEFYTAYDGAAKLPLEPWSTSNRQYRRSSSSLDVTENKVTYTHDGSREELTGDEIKVTFSEFLKNHLGFRDEECVWFGEKSDAYGEEKFVQWKTGNLVAGLTQGAPNECSEGDFLPSIDDQSGEGFSDLGSYFAVNPFKTGDSRKPENISRYLYTMVESDKLPREEQLALFKRCGLPIKCLIDTGNKSIHAIVKVDAANLSEYKERVERIHEYLGGKEAGFDSTKDPVRFSRLPNCKHAKGRQRLISLQVGAASWQAWEEANIDDGLDFDDMAGELAEELPEPKHLVKECICKGDVAIFGGPSKSFKTWSVMELALAVSQGTKFLKWECQQGKVFMVDTEMKRKRFNDRFAMIARARGESIDPDDIGRLLLRGKKMAIEDLVPLLIRRLKGKNYDMVFIDSIYLLLGKREENSNEDISDLGVWLHKLAVELDVAVVFTHHFSKGSQAAKRSIEKFSGAGAWGRFVDAAIAIDANPEADCFNLEPDFRDFAKQSSFVIRRAGAVWAIDNNVKVASKTNANEKGAMDDFLDILANECSGECSPSEWFEACKAKLGVKSWNTFNSRKTKALKAGFIEQTGKTSNTVVRLLAVKDATTAHYRARTSEITVDADKVTFEQE